MGMKTPLNSQDNYWASKTFWTKEKVRAEKVLDLRRENRRFTGSWGRAD